MMISPLTVPVSTCDPDGYRVTEKHLMSFITATSSSVILRGKGLLKPTDFDVSITPGRFDVHASASACKAKYVVL